MSRYHFVHVCRCIGVCVSRWVCVRVVKGESGGIQGVCECVYIRLCVCDLV